MGLGGKLEPSVDTGLRRVLPRRFQDETCNLIEIWTLWWEYFLDVPDTTTATRVRNGYAISKRHSQVMRVGAVEHCGLGKAVTSEVK